MVYSRRLSFGGNMSKARQTKQGLLIPSSMLKGIQAPVSVRRGGKVLIVESKAREAARRRMTRMVKKLRAASTDGERITAGAIADEVETVRRSRAGHR